MAEQGLGIASCHSSWEGTARRGWVWQGVFNFDTARLTPSDKPPPARLHLLNYYQLGTKYSEHMSLLGAVHSHYHTMAVLGPSEGVTPFLWSSVFAKFSGLVFLVQL